MIGLGLGLVRQAVRNASGQAWTPAQLFSDGQQGVWYEPKPQYLFQDADGTVPVTADGDHVGYMQDLSGNGNHATQATSAARPIYRTDGVLHWLEGDGVGRGMNTPLKMSLAGGKRTAIISFRHVTDNPGYVFSDTSNNIASHRFGYLVRRESGETSTAGVGEHASAIGSYALAQDAVFQINTDRDALTLAGSIKAGTGAVETAQGIDGGAVSEASMVIMQRADQDFGLNGRIYGTAMLSDSNTPLEGNSFYYFARLAGVPV